MWLVWVWLGEGGGEVRLRDGGFGGGGLRCFGVASAADEVQGLAHYVCEGLHQLRVRELGC